MSLYTKCDSQRELEVFFIDTLNELSDKLKIKDNYNAELYTAKFTISNDVLNPLYMTMSVGKGINGSELRHVAISVYVSDFTVEEHRKFPLYGRWSSTSDFPGYYKYNNFNFDQQGILVNLAAMPDIADLSEYIWNYYQIRLHIIRYMTNDVLSTRNGEVDVFNTLSLKYHMFRIIDNLLYKVWMCEKYKYGRYRINIKIFEQYDDEYDATVNTSSMAYDINILHDSNNNFKLIPIATDPKCDSEFDDIDSVVIEYASEYSICDIMLTNEIFKHLKVWISDLIKNKILSNRVKIVSSINTYDIVERGKNMNGINGNEKNEVKSMLLHLRNEGQDYTYNDLIDDITKNIEVCFKRALGDKPSKYSIFNMRYSFYYNYINNGPSEIEYALNITAPMYLEGIPYFVIESIVPSGTLFYSRLYKRGITDDINTVKVFPMNVNILQPTDIPTIISRGIKDNFDMTELYNMYIDHDEDIDVLRVYDTTDINADYVNFGKQIKEDLVISSNMHRPSANTEKNIFTDEQMAYFIEKLDLKSEINKMIVKKLYASLDDKED